MDYSAYEAEDFIMDNSFRNYCLGNNETDIRFWENWIGENPEKQALIREAKEMLLLLSGSHHAAQFAADKNRFETSFQEHTASEAVPSMMPAVKSTPIKKAFWYAAAAAAVILLMLYYPFHKQDKQNAQAALQYNYTEVSKTGERKSFQLPDGSKVMMNAGSTIEIARDFNRTNRKITLSGEAFFDVAHNPEKPFIIHTANMDVRVLGTVFNVKAYPGDKLSETSLIKGSVEVTVRNDANRKILLKPNQKIVLPNSIATEPVPSANNKKTQIDLPDFTIKGLTYDKVDSTLAEVSWTENKLVFTDNSFEEIAAELQRWYNINIVFANDEVKQYRFTAVFDQKNIVQVLDALQLSRNFEYKIEENNKIKIGK